MKEPTGQTSSSAERESQPARLDDRRAQEIEENTLGPGDQRRVDEYLESVREVEQRIQRAESASRDNPLPDVDRPSGVPAAYADHARLMFDLQLLALQGNVTRVTTFQMARETSNRTYPRSACPMLIIH